MIIDIFLTMLIKIMELYSTWIPNWTMPDGLITSFTYLISYSKYAGIWINTDAFWGSAKLVLETLILIATLKAIMMFVGFLRGTHVE